MGTTNEVDVFIKEIDNGYIVKVSRLSDFASCFASERAIVGAKDVSKTAEDLLQFACEEILFKLIGRTKSFGGKLHAHAKVSVSFTEDPYDPVESH